MPEPQPPPAIDIDQLRELAKAATDAEVHSVSNDAAALQDFRHEFTPSVILALIAELTELRAQAGGWVAAGDKPPPHDRYVLVWDRGWGRQYQPENLRAHVSPNLTQQWLDCSGNVYCDIDPEAHLWRELPSPPEATDG